MTGPRSWRCAHEWICSRSGLGARTGAVVRALSRTSSSSGAAGLGTFTFAVCSGRVNRSALSPLQTALRRERALSHPGTTCEFVYAAPVAAGSGGSDQAAGSPATIRQVAKHCCKVEWYWTAVMRCLRGRNRFETRAKAERNRWAEGGDRDPPMRLSRTLVGWCACSTLLLQRNAEPGVGCPA